MYCKKLLEFVNNYGLNLKCRVFYGQDIKKKSKTGNNVSNGIYLCPLKEEDRIFTGKML